MIDALKGNLLSAHNETEMEALDKLTNIFLEASKKASGLETPASAPRVEGEQDSLPNATETQAAAPRVQNSAEPIEQNTAAPPRVSRKMITSMKTNTTPNLSHKDTTHDPKQNNLQEVSHNTVFYPR